jgi:hypothetical protein
VYAIARQFLRRITPGWWLPGLVRCVAGVIARLFVGGLLIRRLFMEMFESLVRIVGERRIGKWLHGICLAGG